MRALLPDKEQKRFFDNFAREVSMSNEKTHRTAIILEKSFVHTNPDPTTDPPVIEPPITPRMKDEESNGKTTRSSDSSVGAVGDRE